MGEMDEYKINYRQKGIDLAEQDKHEEAIVCFDKAISLHKDIGCEEDPEILISKGKSLMELGREKEAKTCFERAIELIDEDMEDYYENIPIQFRSRGLNSGNDVFNDSIFQLEDGP
jgi:tetratricopeptide (TPR) repeat protein